MGLQAHAVEDSFEAFGQQLGDMMEEMTRRSYYRFSKSTTWRPAVNVYHDPTHFYICFDLAGLTREQVHVDVLGNKITVRGDRPAPPPPQGGGQVSLLRMEISSGMFERSVELPEQADMNSVSARLAEGFLWLTIRKHGREKAP
jgi:HSP20 family protein